MFRVLAIIISLLFSAMPVQAQDTRVEAYYITPYIQLWVNGDGTFSETDPGGGQRMVNGPRVLLTGVWNTGARSSSIIPISARGKAKDHSITWVLTEPAHHTTIQADSENILVPFTPAELDNAYSTLSAPEQSGLESFLASIFMDDQWIQQTSSLRSIVSYVIHVIFTGQQLGSDYPDMPLTARWNSLTTPQQTAISNLLAEKNRPAVSGNPQLREIINNLAQADYGTIRFGNEEFGNWTP